MLRWLLIVVALAGCTSAEEKARIKQEQYEARLIEHRQKCIEYGFKPETGEYAQCLQRLDEIYAQWDAQRRAAVLSILGSRMRQQRVTVPALPAPTVNTYCYRAGNSVNCRSQ